jgi:tetratricopeptide (TPR) repeat protein
MERARILKRAFGVALVLSAVLTGCKIAGADGNVDGRSSARSTPDTTGTTGYFAEPVSVATPEPARPASFDEAEALYHERRYREASDWFASYVVDRPENAWGHYMLGLSAWKAGDPTLAETAFIGALGIDPDHLKSRLNLTRVLLEAGRPEEALDHASLAVDVDSTSAEAHRLFARALADLGEVTDAIIAYRTAISLNDQDVWALNNLGLLLLQQDQTSQALGPLARAVELSPGVAVFHNNLGMALERCGYFRAAADQYRLAAGAGSGHQKAAANLSRIEGREDQPGLPALDLPAAGREFVESVKR